MAVLKKANHHHQSIIKNVCLRKGCLPQSICLASITLLLKKDKDPLHSAPYRSISVINVDYKIIAKVLALRLESV